MTNCIYCGKPVTDAEVMVRYAELAERGIIPTLLPSHKKCREEGKVLPFQKEKK